MVENLLYLDNIRFIVKFTKESNRWLCVLSVLVVETKKEIFISTML